MTKSKPIDALQPADLAAHPIWEYSMDEDEGDETWVCPYSAPVVPVTANDYQVYHVAADFHAANGKTFVGFFSICEGDFHDPAPAIVGDGENYWNMDSAPYSRKERLAFERFFGASFEKLFPMRWVMRARIGKEKKVRADEYTP